MTNSTISIGGGLGDEYMRAPQLRVGGGDNKGHGSFIANLLDLLGVNHQVAKEPKGDKGVGNATAAAASGKAEKGSVNGASQGKQVSATAGAPAYTPGLSNPTSPIAAPPPAGLTILDDAHAAFSPMTPRASKFGMGLTMLPNALR